MVLFGFMTHYVDFKMSFIKFYTSSLGFGIKKHGSSILMNLTQQWINHLYNALRTAQLARLYALQSIFCYSKHQIIIYDKF